MDEEWTEAPQWESELLEEAFSNLFPSSGPFSSDFGMPVSSPWQDYPLFLDPEVPQYDMTDGSFENTLAVEDHMIDMLTSQNIDLAFFQNATPGPDVSGGVAYQLYALSPQLSIESDPAITTSPKTADFQACLHEFDGGPKSISPRRKRKQFSTERRKEVSQLRKVGACLRCRLTKSKVSFLLETI